MEITASAVAIYATLALLVAAFGSFCVALFHHSRVRTQGKPALARSLNWSGIGFMLFSSCGLVAELNAFGRINTGYYLVIIALFILGALMFLKARELKGN
ncbi:hypothetical protein BH11CYA1_BH11CYA1_48540 [soil metagenome]